MKQRKLGNEGLVVSELGLGCMGMTQSYPPFRPDTEMIQLMHEAVELGINFFDTAQVYGPYANETLVGKALKPIRSSIAIVTKFGFDLANGGNGTGSPTGLDSRPKTIKSSVEGSLKRLQTDHIDLLYQHRVDPQVPIEEVAATVQELIQAGKVLYWGLSEASENTIRRAHAICPLSAVQSEYSLWYREPEKKVLPALQELGIGFVPFSPLGKGFLTGQISHDAAFENNDFRNSIPRFSQENLSQNMKLLEALDTIASDCAATPAQIALAWLLAQKPWIVPIPGTKRLSRLQENIGAADITLSDSQLERIHGILSSIDILGERYPASAEALIDK